MGENRLGAKGPREDKNVPEAQDDVGVQKPDRTTATGMVLSHGRVASVDALRGLTILLMIFVNDLGPHAPSWMHHIQPPNADGMTLADVVFPAFLFIVGISIPLAIERRPGPPDRTIGSARAHRCAHSRAPVHGSGAVER